MTIANEITRINNNISAAYVAAEYKGATLPATQNSANLADTIYTISEKLKYGLSIDNFIGDINLSGKLLIPEQPQLLSFSNVKNLADYALYYKFANYNDIITVNFPNLTDVGGKMALTGAFKSQDSEGSIAMLSFPELKNITGREALNECFYGQISLKTVSFPELLKINNSYGMANCFNFCSNLRSITFPKLNDISNYYVFYMAFGYTALTSLSFPALKTTSFGNTNTQFHNMLQGVSGCTIHFPSNLQSVIGNWSDVTNGFGGTNTTVLFDLPATS